ncbi:MAG: cysteine desulfurase-like protein [Phycisphaerales bacterium]|nr:MAG: cysteine desulfurase-like protein [Phycisphaerales bacterium]
MREAGQRPFPIEWVRRRFPAVRIAENRDPSFAFMDNAGGAQAPDSALDQMRRYFCERHVYHAGPYDQARMTEEAFAAIRRRMAHFMGASSPDEIVFGLNATTLLSLFSASLGQILEAGDEIITTCLEHEANVTPWLRLKSVGAATRFWKPRGPDGVLDIEDLRQLLSDRTRVVAVTGASNILGTVTDIARVAEVVHDHGAVLVVDGVHYAPHRRINIRRDSIDAFVCSGYKLFGAHIGFLACSRDLLDRLPSLNHYFLGDKAKLELGVQNFEGMAATEGVLQYLSDLAGESGIAADDLYDQLFEAIAAYERTLSEQLISGLNEVEGVHVYGITDPKGFDMRTPTAAITVEGHRPEEIARRLGERGLGVNHGHMYAPRVIEWLGLADSGGVVRVSLCHYNTPAEIERLLAVIAENITGVSVTSHVGAS